MGFWDKGDVVAKLDRYSLENADGHWCIALRDEDGGGMASNYRDEKEAREAWAAFVAGPPCKECGVPPFGEWEHNTARQMKERGLCFSCNHWTNTFNKRDAGTVVIAGWLYQLEPDKPRGYQGFVGHGGAEFVIQHEDGRTVTTHNLWAGGRVPKHFRDRLPDNAVFVARAPYSAYAGNGNASCVHKEAGS